MIRETSVRFCLYILLDYLNLLHVPISKYIAVKAGNLEGKGREKEAKQEAMQSEELNFHMLHVLKWDYFVVCTLPDTHTRHNMVAYSHDTCM
jgi:hypothetical protein